MAFVDASAKRRTATAFEDLDRAVVGTSWGVGIAFDRSRGNLRKWDRIRQRTQLRHQHGHTGASLEREVMKIGAMFPGHVIHEQAQT